MRLRLLVGAAAAISLICCAGAFAAVDSGHRWLANNLRPEIYSQAVWCWESESAKAAIAASESRRDTFVVRIVLLGAEATRRRAATSINQVAASTIRLDRDTNRLGYVYAYFWSSAERQRLFERVAATRPVCSPGFGRPAPRPVTR